MAAFMQVPCHLAGWLQDTSLCALPAMPRNILMGSGLVSKEPSLEWKILLKEKKKK